MTYFAWKKMMTQKILMERIIMWDQNYWPKSNRSKKKNKKENKEAERKKTVIYLYLYILL